MSSIGVKIPLAFDTNDGFKMLKSYRATVKQNLKMLLLTNDSKLTHIVRGSDNIVFWDTMKIRQRFRK